MKELIVVFLLILISFGCSKENNADEYYVKYEVESSTIYYGGKLNVSLNTEDNSTFDIIIDQKINWEMTIGPVKKGFVASLSVSAPSETYDKLTIGTKISVSKNNGPFAVKLNDSSTAPRDMVESSYTIDF